MTIGRRTATKLHMSFLSALEFLKDRPKLYLTALSKIYEAEANKKSPAPETSRTSCFRSPWGRPGRVKGRGRHGGSPPPWLKPAVEAARREGGSPNMRLN